MAPIIVIAASMFWHGPLDIHVPGFSEILEEEYPQYFGDGSSSDLMDPFAGSKEEIPDPDEEIAKKED